MCFFGFVGWFFGGVCKGVDFVFKKSRCFGGLPARWSSYACV